ncbi:MAG: CHAT domain-containing protein [Chitinophagaceae bacterium]|nr:CHAT domain-containing protein [Chitinophagaceae bacterium]
MNRIILSFLLILLLVITFSQEKSVSYLKEYNDADKLYLQAEKFSQQADFPVEKSDLLNAAALRTFKVVLKAIEKAHNDSLAFHTCFKIGVLEHYFDSISSASYYYSKAIALHSRIKGIPDSFLFKPCLFLGGIQYRNNQFDSALVKYKRAEQIAAKYTVSLEGTNRLYNTLGAMNFETGNYQQAKNYFEKAISLLQDDIGSNSGLLINYKINLAATLTKLEDYDAANTIYHELLKQDINKNDILHNVGKINLLLGAGRKALSYFRQVNYNNNTVVRLLNDFGQAFESINEPDSARYYYMKALTENQHWNKTRKNVQAGLSLSHLGNLDLLAGKQMDAIDHYQKAIIQFINDYNEPDIYNNPQQFSSVFSYINLFNTLTAKAVAFEKLYQSKKNEKDLATALETYRSAFDLAAYVEKTYDSDEARQFLNKIKYSAHGKPINICLQLYQLTGKKSYLEQAYLFDQQNKASILSLSIREKELKTLSAGNSSLLQQVAALKSKTTRLSIKSAGITDSNQLKTIYSEIRDNEIELGKLYEKIKSDPLWQQVHLGDQIPPVMQLQKKLDNITAIISYHLSEDELLAFILTRNQFYFFKSPINTNFFSTIDSFKYALNNTRGGQRYDGNVAARRLFDILIFPLQQKLTKTERLVIIPDDELHYLPFEALTDKQDNYLLERYSVQYLYSAALFQEKTNRPMNSGVLSFAPFSAKGYSEDNQSVLSKLPESANEISELQGKSFLSNLATKKVFFNTPITSRLFILLHMPLSIIGSPDYHL